jgi:hypothetical protein
MQLPANSTLFYWYYSPSEITGTPHTGHTHADASICPIVMVPP